MFGFYKFERSGFTYLKVRILHKSAYVADFVRIRGKNAHIMCKGKDFKIVVKICCNKRNTGVRW